MKKKKRILCLLLTFALTLGTMPAMAFAEEAQESKCSHIHDENCGYQEEQAEIPCDQNCADTDGDNIADHTAQCSYTPAVEAHPCGHVHDETCGGLPTDDDNGEEPNETELTIPCAVTEGCILEDGHAGDCVLENEDTFEDDNSANVTKQDLENIIPQTQANSAKASGVKYSLDDDGNGGYILTFSGEGEIRDYPDHQNSKGWYSSSHKITKIVVEEGITYIGDYALSETAATELVLPSTVEEISDLAFYSHAQVYNCLESITIPEENQYYKIEDEILFTKDGSVLVKAPVEFKTGITEYTLPETVERIGTCAFANASLKKIDLDNNNLKEIGQYAFLYSRLEEVYISDTVTKIEEHSFSSARNPLKVRIGKGLKELPLMAFLVGEVYEVTFDEPSSITYMDQSSLSFSNYEIDDMDKYVELPSTLEKLGIYAVSLRGGNSIHLNLTKLNIIPENYSEYISVNDSLNDFIYVKDQSFADALSDGNKNNTAILVTNGGVIEKPDTLSSKPITPSKAGWDFDGWYEDADLSTPASSFSEGNTYYAKWINGVESTLYYEVDADHPTVIIEKDSADETHYETITLIPPVSAAYDGTEKTATTEKSKGWQGGDVRVIHRNEDNQIVTPVEGGTYTAEITIGGATAKITFTISTSDSDVTAKEVQGTYGDTLTLSVSIQKSSPEISTFSVEEDTVSFYNEKDELLGTADVKYGVSTTGRGTATLKYPTVSKGIPVGESTVTAVFGGSSSLNGSEVEIPVTLSQKQLTLSTNADAVDRNYNGTTDVTIRSLRITDGIEEDDSGKDDVRLLNADKGTAATALPGEDIEVTLSCTLTGEDKDWYKLPELGTLTVTIKKISPTVTLSLSKDKLQYGDTENTVYVTAAVSGSGLTMTEENSKGKVDFYYAETSYPSSHDYKYLGTAETVFNDDGTVTAVFEYTVDTSEIGSLYFFAKYQENDIFNASRYSSGKYFRVARRDVIVSFTAEDREYINIYDLITAEPTDPDYGTESYKASYKSMTVPISNLQLTGVLPGDDVSIIAAEGIEAYLGEGYWGMVDYPFGDDLPVYPMIDLSGTDSNKYKLEFSEVKVTITKADTQTTAEDITGTYGDTIAITANVELAETSTLSRTSVQPNTAAFYYGDTLLGTSPVSYEEVMPEHSAYRSRGTAVINYDTTEKILPAGTSEIKVVYGGSDDLHLNGSEYSTLKVTINKKPLTFTGDVTAKDREYDGTNIVALEGTGTFTGVISGDDVSLGEITKGVLSTPDAGNNRPVRIADNALIGDDSAYYTFADMDGVTVNILKANQEISYEDTSISKKTNSDDFTNPLTKTKVFGQITYESDNENVAKVNVVTGEVTIVGRGTAVITATAEGSDNFTEAEASYKLTVTKRSSGGGGSSSSSNADDTDKEDAKEHTSSDQTIQKDVPTLNKENHFAYMSGYLDGTFKPNQNITRAEVAVMFSRLIDEDFDSDNYETTSFLDVAEDEWYSDRIGYIESLGIINGYPDSTFRPNAPITRAEFATIAANFDNLKETGDAYFSDLPDSHWAKNFVEMAYNRGWISGYPDGTIKPDRYITRAEVVSVVNRMLEREADISYIDLNKNDIKNFTDVDAGNWAYYDIIEACNGHYYETDDTEIWTSLMK
ncbi:S-layer homology domain-containing protein [Anaerotignum lactatifermentans]|uniref:Listeria/Bacterioides repeat-containing protein n=1 Tax=Anaerotignum lactatifermentans DSM 14214 TaxID=1121323 RepID=A0A1M6XUS3_9FIRM|nr:S-layer homology domain-containing protein [Anaerotignum lactatifermentans]SHL09603.1 Listeria/Bacterioides repeat-containing protein [[Clostridium] lactatifermentans DSM 14214] [Anaerotignum lactatifermentans DSM 14214]